uniref:Piezo non-specific cation channel R-Ras-binding domain-containing protein n=1 Tax=Chenopodium quinoa TaxID=63459 RepID=A0A803MX47_CHEQI
MGNQGGQMESGRYIVGGANRAHEVPLLEISNCNILCDYTSNSGFCLFSLVISAQTRYGSLARFLLGELLIHFGVIRWWRSLQLYACFNILILYTYQLPVQFPTLLQQIANFLGLYKISVESGWLEICSGLSLICFYVMNMEIWELVGLWRYTIPGYFLLAQFGLGVLIAVGNLVNNSVFTYLSNENGHLPNGDPTIEVKEETKVLIVATIAWGFRKCSRAIMLALIFLIAMKPGFIHAIYSLRDSSWDFLETALLACFCTIHNHGFDMLFSFSAFVQHTPYPPVGFSVLKAGLNKSVLLSVYCSSASGDSSNGPSHERRIASYLSAVGQKFLAVYRSWGTYIAFLTILIAVYLTKRRLWFPLKAYAIMVFVFMYSLSIFPSFQTWLSHIIDLYPNLGYKPEASLLDNIWESMAILIVMQLYSYERRQSKYNEPCDTNVLQSGTVGFMRRFMIWHSNKLLFAALFYAAISQINAIGFVYLLGMIICSTFPKTSRVPSKSFLVYTGFVVMVEYLFQMWGQQAKMFPGQMHSDVSHVLGLQVFEPGFWGIESSLRGNVLVISACTLQYNVFHWLDRMPNNNVLMGEWEEPCPLFVTAEDDAVTMSSYDEENSSVPHSTLSDMVKTTASYTWKSNTTDPSEPILLGRESENSRTERYSSGYFWETIKESQKWNKRRILALRNERFDMQKTTLKVYLMFWIENMFNLFGLEINMIVLLLASFALLNVISLLYIGLLATFVLLDRRIIRKLWSVLVFLFACVLILEYFSIWENKMSLNRQSPHEIAVRCHDCWKSSKLHFQYCQRCWLGLVVDDTRMLISYFIVFIVACFKLRADRSPNLSGSFTFNQMMSQRKNIFVWKDLSFETKSMWTIFDYLRLYCYCHLLDLVLTLILITGTLEYDILHLGYLGFALVFFRMRLEILRKRNKIFKFLRMYNFVIIVLSLAYQSPFIGVFNEGKCGTVGYIYEAIGFYKYDYGFRITSRSALVEIVIFMLVSLQSYMFSSPEFEHVSRYLEAEQIGAIVREQEKKAAWKTSQLQHIRETEEEKRQRNMQVEKMKSEMLDLQVQLHSMNSPGNHGQLSPGSGGLRKRRSASFIVDKNFTAADKEELLSPSFNFDRGFRAAHTLREGQKTSGDFALPSELLGSPVKRKSESPIAEQLTTQDSKEISFGEITEIEDSDHQSVVEKKRESSKGQSKDHPLKSAVQLIGDGVSQVQSLGNQAVTNLASLLNVSQEDLDSTGHSSDDDVGCGEMESQNPENVHIARTSSLQSDKSRTMSESVKLKLLRIFRHIWSQMRSNNDIVCYCCFILVFLWNFSLLSMVYLAALFFYALCVNTGPSYTFWVVMLIYTEFYILIEYLYQIIIQHCGLIDLTLLQELGFPHHKINSSFVISSLPLFLVYLFTLLQSSITAQDGDWSALSEFNAIKRKMHERKYVGPCSSWSEKLNKIFQPLKDGVEMIARSCLSYWKSLTQGAESPPYFVQLSMDVGAWPEDGIQPEKIESGMNQLLQLVHSEHCKGENPNVCPSACRVNIQSIERSEENPNVALAVFEVVHALPLRDCVSKGWSKSLTPASDVAREVLIAKCLGYVEEVGFPYPVLSVIGGGKREVDLYAYVFGADLAVFFLVAIFYQSVIKNKSDFLGVYQLEDQFPKEYVFILMVIFFLIVVDRIIYLCSFATGKVLFYLFNLVLFTYSVTEYAWNMQPFQQYAGILALRAIFLTKAVSLALQAIQIRYGMPHKSTLYRQFLTSTVSRINYLGYRLYRALPFLYELRCVLDWSCTTTSLTMYDWLKMYSSGNPTNIANPVRDVSVQVDIKTNGGRLTLYQTTLCEKLEWENVKNKDDLDPQGLLTTYDMNDIQLICCQADASTLWLVPEVVQKRFTESLNVGRDMHIIFSWVLTRDRPKGKEVVKYERDVDNASDLPKRSELQSVFNGSMNSFRVKNIFPRFFRVTGSGDVRPFEPELKVDADLVINHQNPEWWSFYDVNPLNVSRCEGLTGPTAIVVSEETPQGLLGDTLSKFSIWGLYITFVLAVGRFIRLQCSDLRMRIPYENLPSCDRLIAICEDIYAARAEGELGVEEVLYWTLVKIYRSPHMLLEYTKPD